MVYRLPLNYTGALQIDMNISIENNLVVNQDLMDVFTAGWRMVLQPHGFSGASCQL